MPYPDDDDELPLNEIAAIAAESVDDPFQESNKKLSSIKAQLSTMIDILADNPSLFARAARYWGELPLWQKIVGGFVVTLPTLVLGILTTIGSIITFSICSLLAYAGIGFILDNHYSSSASTTAGLKQGIGSLADMLGTVVQSLEDIEQDMSAGIDRFTEENKTLEGNVGTFQQRIADMTLQMDALRANVQTVSTAKEQLEKTAASLGKTVDEQKVLLEQNQLALREALQNLERAQQELSTKIREFDSERTGLNAEVTRLKGIGDVLQGAVTEMSSSVFQNDKTRDEFLQRMNTMLSDSSQSFSLLSAELSKVQKENKALAAQLHEANEGYQRRLAQHSRLLEQQKVQTDRLSDLRATSSSSSTTAPTSTNRYTKFNNPSSGNQGIRVVGFDLPAPQ